MSSYDDMTKEQLLEEAQARGLSPANASMSKGELREALEADDEGGGLSPEQLVTTTMTKDFLGVPLVNATPGTSQATDRLGRSVIAGNKDYLARNLVP